MTYNGKQFPCYITSTENGRFTSEELTLTLKWMDDREVCDPSDGVDPILIVDGHSSRMMGPFLKYVNDHEHRWNIMLGVSYGIHL
jgi:hypothetical protein